MEKKIQLLIPMSGQGTRYQKAGYSQPKPLIPINGVPMIERLLKSFPEYWPANFIMAENHRSTGLPQTLKRLRPTANQYFLEPHTQGPSYAVIKFIDELPNDQPVLLSYCDYGLVWDAQRFEDFVFSSDCDACLISYRGFHPHYLSETKYAYSRLENGLVKEVKEKGSFTDNRENEFASCGAYYFKSAQLLKTAIQYQFKNDIKLNGEFYTSLTVQALLQMMPEAHVRVFEISGFFQWGTPEDLKTYEYWEHSYQSLNKSISSRLHTEQLMIPMAGLGSRFSAITKTRKPLIKIGDMPMFEKAISTLPQANQTLVVSVNEVIANIKSSKGNQIYKTNLDYLSLDSVPAGQALTVEMGLKYLDLNKSIFISACDHGLVLDPKLWQQVQTFNIDAVVFTVSGFPGVGRSPLSYSYVKGSENCRIGTLPQIQSIHVKSPISNNPINDPLLVGSFWFRNGHILKEGIESLKTRGSLVNNELYLDGIFDELNKIGYRCVLLPLSGYFNWGDPVSLKEAMYWEEVFMGQALEPRNAFKGVEL